MDWKGLIGKKVFIRTKFGKVYSGKVLFVDGDIEPLITINDKYNKSVSVIISHIVECKEE